MTRRPGWWQKRWHHAKVKWRSQHHHARSGDLGVLDPFKKPTKKKLGNGVLGGRFKYWIAFYKTKNVMYIYLDLPKGAKWFLKGVNSPSLRVELAPLGRCWYIYIYNYSLSGCTCFVFREKRHHFLKDVYLNLPGCWVCLERLIFQPQPTQRKDAVSSYRSSIRGTWKVWYFLA